MPKAFWADDDIRLLLKLMLPTLFGVAVYQINIIILRNLASDLPDGHVTYYNIASRLQELIIGVFAFAYATASLPEFSKHTSQQDWKESIRHTQRLYFFSNVYCAASNSRVYGIRASRCVHALPSW